MGLFDSDLEKAEKFEEKKDWRKAAFHYNKAWQKDRDSFALTKLYHLALKYPYDVSAELKIFKDNLVQDAIDYLMSHVSDGNMAAIINYWLNVYKGNTCMMRWVDQWERIEKCLNLFKDKDSYLYKNLINESRPLYEKAMTQKQNDLNRLTNLTDEEKRLGITRVNKPGGFYDICEYHPN